MRCSDALSASTWRGWVHGSSHCIPGRSISRPTVHERRPLSRALPRELRSVGANGRQADRGRPRPAFAGFMILAFLVRPEAIGLLIVGGTPDRFPGCAGRRLSKGRDATRRGAPGRDGPRPDTLCRTAVALKPAEPTLTQKEKSLSGLARGESGPALIEKATEQIAIRGCGDLVSAISQPAGRRVGL